MPSIGVLPSVRLAANATTCNVVRTLIERVGGLMIGGGGQITSAFAMYVLRLLSSRLTDGDKQDLLRLTSRVRNWAQCVLAATNFFRTPRSADLTAGVSGSALYLLKCRLEESGLVAQLTRTRAHTRTHLRASVTI